MKSGELFKWTFTVSGLWLILAPFLLFGGPSAASTALIGDAGILLIMGLSALIVAGYSYSKHTQMPSYLGLIAGLGLFIAPWLFEFTNVIAFWNAVIIGAILSVVALFEFLKEKPAYSSI